MTYRSRGRSIFEVVVAVMFTGFLIGFITVLCIGNYFRAKRAQERQRQRRLAKAAAAAGSGTAANIVKSGGGSLGGSPRSTFTPETNDGSAGGYEAPQIPSGAAGGVHA